MLNTEPPEALYVCLAEPEKPLVDTGDNERDWKNVSGYVVRLREALADCQEKLKNLLQYQQEVK